MKVCLFYKKLPQKFWVVEVEWKGSSVYDIQTADCINRNPHSCVTFQPMELSENQAKKVMKFLEDKFSVAGASIVREEDYQFHQ
ncbi:hypothetical protein HPMBJEAJ_00056 [Aeromonas phage avDM6]|nr:hypothetical protein HPMBJEAJ_00056 [Aeromonas phage avDM6]